MIAAPSSNNAWIFRLAAMIALAGCGGSQTPAESPEAEPAPTEESTPSADPAPEGEHTMPDGTTMPGHEHGEHESSPAE